MHIMGFFKIIHLRWDTVVEGAKGPTRVSVHVEGIGNVTANKSA